MSIQEINLGSAPEGVAGDTNRRAFEKVNENFASLVETFDVTVAGTSIAVPFTFEQGGGYLVTFVLTEGANSRSVTGVAVIGGGTAAQRTWIALGDNGVGTNRYSYTEVTGTGLTVTTSASTTYRVRGSVLRWMPPSA